MTDAEIRGRMNAALLELLDVAPAVRAIADAWGCEEVAPLFAELGDDYAHLVIGRALRLAAEVCNVGDLEGEIGIRN